MRTTSLPGGGSIHSQAITPTIRPLFDSRLHIQMIHHDRNPGAITSLARFRTEWTVNLLSSASRPAQEKIVTQGSRSTCLIDIHFYHSL
jgi:hypothetical protein